MCISLEIMTKQLVLLFWHKYRVLSEVPRFQGVQREDGASHASLHILHPYNDLIVRRHQRTRDCLFRYDSCLKITTCYKHVPMGVDFHRLYFIHVFAFHSPHEHINTDYAYVIKIEIDLLRL